MNQRPTKLCKIRIFFFLVHFDHQKVTSRPQIWCWFHFCLLNDDLISSSWSIFSIGEIPGNTMPGGNGRPFPRPRKNAQFVDHGAVLRCSPRWRPRRRVHQIAHSFLLVRQMSNICLRCMHQSSWWLATLLQGGQHRFKRVLSARLLVPYLQFVAANLRGGFVA